MTKKQRIELYLDSQKAVLDSKNPYYSSNTGKSTVARWHPRHDDLYIVKKGIFGLTEKENKFISQLEELASQKHIKLKVYDTKNLGHSIRAYFKGIEETPAVIIGKKKFTKDNFDLDRLNKTVNKSTYESTMDADRFRNGLLLIAVGSFFGLLAIIFQSSRLFCLSGFFSAVLIGVGCLVSFGNLLDRFFDWAN